MKTPANGGEGEARGGNETEGKATPIPSGEVFDEDVSWRLATAVIRSLRGFRFAGAGTEAAAVPGELGHTPEVRICPDGSVSVDDGPRRVALAGLRLAGAAATAPGPARALLESGVFHVLWRLPSDPAATPAGIALALGALCQGVRHAEILQVFSTKMEIKQEGSSVHLGGYEACAAVLSGQVKKGMDALIMLVCFGAWADDENTWRRSANVRCYLIATTHTIHAHRRFFVYVD